MTTSAFFPPGGVLVASASASLREQVLLNLHDPPCQVHEASGGADALVKLERGSWQLLFLDRRLPDLDAEELSEIIKHRFPGIEVIVLDSQSGQIFPAAVKTRWQQYLRPCVESEEPGNENSEPLPGMIGDAESMQRLYEMARLVAPRLTTVLIMGDTGTGKELVARALHQLSPRSARPFVVVNCAAIPETLLESELFGYARGAFTGAVQAYAGRIQVAQGGTLFLDEVGELPLGLQAKLLRFLDQKEVQRLGSPEHVRVDVRVIAATNNDLAEAVEQGKFREDLYYRLAAFPLQLPSLRERVSDVRPLAEHFLSRIAAESRMPRLRLSSEVLRVLERHPWEGNVRELQQVMERAAILASKTELIQPHHLYFSKSRKRPDELLKRA